MTTWAVLKGTIREELKDTGSTLKFSDNLLWVYVKDGLADYSLYLPQRTDRHELELSGSYYPLPADFVDEIYVECPADRILERRHPRPGIRFPSKTGRPFFYHIQGGNLYLDGSPLEGDQVLLTYLSVHPSPDAEDDGDFVFTIPTSDEELIRLYVRAKCYEQLRSRQASLDRYKDRMSSGGDRQDNPLEPEVTDLMEEYRRKLSERVGGGVIYLYRSGRTK